MAEFKKNYSPSEFENEIFNLWNKFDCFHAKVDYKKQPFSIVLPPPNITGQLHMGHALNITLQDVIVRFKRMQGFETLLLPGVDHAAIATEARIVENLKKQNKSKADLGREKFLELAWSWKADFENKIFNQIKKLGTSCDYKRRRFTMDAGCHKAVNEFFVNLFKDGLIYRGERVINWCFTCKTSISDAEVEHKEQEGSLWHLKYFLVDEKSRFLEVATTRPETLFGDVAVAVNPKDERYASFIGKLVCVPLIGRKIPVIADSYVDAEFGTGVVKITPAHDFNDFEIGMRHDLKTVRVFEFDGTLNAEAGSFCGVSLKSARNLVVKALKDQGYLTKLVPHVHSVGHCYRCGSVVEPIISKQWFVKMERLAKPAIEVVEQGLLNFVPNHFVKIYLNWLNSVKDWCISRQLWWGHRIPAWFCEDCGKLMVEKQQPEFCSKCGSTRLIQEVDTLDTWFSSALWPFSTLGWPDENSSDYSYFFPTDVLVTGYDIIFFWVVRMVFASLKNTKKLPFKTVLIHGIVRDSLGRKMSKSLGNGIDPIEMINRVGADALRFMLASNTNAGSDVRWSEEKMIAARNFVNKLWNASRFIFLNVEKFENFNLNLIEIPDELELEDRWFLTKLSELNQQLTHNIENFEISVASQKLYDFVWDIFCSWFVELVKIRFVEGGRHAVNGLLILTYSLKMILKLMHPFMPFVTEKINLLVFGDEVKLLAVDDWPKLNFYFDETSDFEKIVEVVKQIRNVRTKMKVEPSKRVDVVIETVDVNLFLKCAKILKNMGGVNELKVVCKFEHSSNKKFVKAFTNSARIFIDTFSMIDLQKQRSQLQNELQKCLNEVEFYKNKLSNEQFLTKAPREVLKKQQDKLKSAKMKLEKVQCSLNELDCFSC